MKRDLLIGTLLLSALLAGCAQKAPEVETAPPQPQVKAVDTGVNTMQEGQESVGYATVDDRIAAISKELQSIYFDTDKYNIRPSEEEKIQSDAVILNGDLAKDLNIKIEGNCDEWGTDEYNYALGLKRAKSVKDALNISGVEESRMTVVSYGESKPVCTEHNPDCWQENRRADIKLFPANL